MHTDRWSDLKRQAGQAATAIITDGMVVGLGSGSTARFATLHLAEKLRQGALRGIRAVPTSDETMRLALNSGIPLVTLSELMAASPGDGAGPRVIDVTIDGADEVDPALNVIKGLGGFLLREKIVASVTRQEIIVVDDRKLVDVLGSRSPVPVEVTQFGLPVVEPALRRTGADTALRMRDGMPYTTDEGHVIIDCHYGSISDAEALSAELHDIPGVVEHGIFLGMVDTVFVASLEGVHRRTK